MITAVQRASTTTPNIILLKVKTTRIAGGLT